MINSNDRSNLVPAPGVSASDAAIRAVGRLGYDAGKALASVESDGMIDAALLTILHIAERDGTGPAAEALANFAAGYRFGADDWQPFDPGDRA